MNYANNSSKFVVVVNKKEPLHRLMNAVAHIAFGMSHRSPAMLDSPVDLYAGSDGSTHCLISRHPFIILEAKNSSQIARLREQCIQFELIYNDFVEQMIAESSERQLEQTRTTPADSLNYLAICV